MPSVSSHLQWVSNRDDISFHSNLFAGTVGVSRSDENTLCNITRVMLSDRHCHCFCILITHSDHFKSLIFTVFVRGIGQHPIPVRTYDRLSW